MIMIISVMTVNVVIFIIMKIMLIISACFTNIPVALDSQDDGGMTPLSRQQQ